MGLSNGHSRCCSVDCVWICTPDPWPGPHVCHMHGPCAPQALTVTCTPVTHMWQQAHMNQHVELSHFYIA